MFSQVAEIQAVKNAFLDMPKLILRNAMLHIGPTAWVPWQKKPRKRNSRKHVCFYPLDEPLVRRGRLLAKLDFALISNAGRAWRRAEWDDCGKIAPLREPWTNNYC
jgi:hypothetical protein